MLNTDSDAIDAIAEIMWPAADPTQEWDPETIEAVGHVIRRIRPEHNFGEA